MQYILGFVCPLRQDRDTLLLVRKKSQGSWKKISGFGTKFRLLGRGFGGGESSMQSDGDAAAAAAGLQWVASWWVDVRKM